MSRDVQSTKPASVFCCASPTKDRSSFLKICGHLNGAGQFKTWQWKTSFDTFTAFGVSNKWWYPNSWMVYNSKTDNKMDDLGVPSFQETSICEVHGFPTFSQCEMSIAISDISACRTGSCTKVCVAPVALLILIFMRNKCNPLEEA